jgi:hypothetical protein
MSTVDHGSTDDPAENKARCTLLPQTDGVPVAAELSSGVRRTFTLLYTPMCTDQAARDIRKEKIEYISDAAQRRRIGPIEDAQQSAEYNDVLQQEADLTAGHGILRTTGLIVAVSAQDSDELERAVADMEQAAIQASCETRRL